MKILGLIALTIVAGGAVGVGELVQGITWETYAMGGAAGFLIAMPFTRWLL